MATNDSEFGQHQLDVEGSASDRATDSEELDEEQVDSGTQSQQSTTTTAGSTDLDREPEAGDFGSNPLDVEGSPGEEARDEGSNVSTPDDSEPTTTTTTDGSGQDAGGSESEMPGGEDGGDGTSAGGETAAAEGGSSGSNPGGDGTSAGGETAAAEGGSSGSNPGGSTVETTSQTGQSTQTQRIGGSGGQTQSSGQTTVESGDIAPDREETFASTTVSEVQGVNLDQLTRSQRAAATRAAAQLAQQIQGTGGLGSSPISFEDIRVKRTDEGFRATVPTSSIREVVEARLEKQTGANVQPGEDFTVKRTDSGIETNITDEFRREQAAPKIEEQLNQQEAVESDRNPFSGDQGPTGRSEFARISSGSYQPFNVGTGDVQITGEDGTVSLTAEKRREIAKREAIESLNQRTGLDFTTEDVTVTEQGEVTLSDAGEQQVQKRRESAQEARRGSARTAVAEALEQRLEQRTGRELEAGQQFELTRAVKRRQVEDVATRGGRGTARASFGQSVKFSKGFVESLIETRLEKQTGEEVTPGEEFQVERTDSGFRRTLSEEFRRSEAAEDIQRQLERKFGEEVTPGEDFTVERTDSGFRTTLSEEFRRSEAAEDIQRQLERKFGEEISRGEFTLQKTDQGFRAKPGDDLLRSEAKQRVARKLEKRFGINVKPSNLTVTNGQVKAKGSATDIQKQLSNQGADASQASGGQTKSAAGGLLGIGQAFMSVGREVSDPVYELTVGAPGNLYQVATTGKGATAFAPDETESGVERLSEGAIQSGFTVASLPFTTAGAAVSVASKTPKAAETIATEGVSGAGEVASNVYSAGAQSVQATVQYAKQNPLLFAGQTAGSLALTGGAFKLAQSAGGSTATKALGYAVQPGEEIASSLGTRALASRLTGARGTALLSRFPNNKIDNEEIVIRGLKSGKASARSRIADLRKSAFVQDESAQLDLAQLDAETDGSDTTETITAEDIPEDPFRASERQRTPRITESRSSGVSRRYRATESRFEGEPDVLNEVTFDEGDVSIDFETRRRLGRLEAISRDAEAASVTVKDATPREVGAESVGGRVESLIDSATRAEVETETASDVKSRIESALESNAESRTESSIESALETETEVATETESETRTETETESRTESALSQETRTETETESRTESALSQETRTEVEGETETETEAVLESESESESEREKLDKLFQIDQQMRQDDALDLAADRRVVRPGNPDAVVEALDEQSDADLELI